MRFSAPKAGKRSRFSETLAGISTLTRRTPCACLKGNPIYGKKILSKFEGILHAFFMVALCLFDRI